MLTDTQTAIFAFVFAVTFWVLFRIITSKQGYVWIKRSEYDQAGEYISYIVRQNEEYKKLLATSNHFPTVAKEQKLFDVKSVKPANGQRYTVTLKDGTYSLPYTDFANWNKGLIKVSRTTYTRKHVNSQWAHNPSVKELWISEDNYSPKESYSDDNLTVYKDKMIELDWRKESDSAPTYSETPLELIY